MLAQLTQSPGPNPQHHTKQAWQYVSVIPALGQWKHEDQKFKIIFGCKVNLKPVWTTWDPVSKEWCSWVWWQVHLTPAHGRQKQADLWDFEINLIYIACQDYLLRPCFKIVCVCVCVEMEGKKSTGQIQALCLGPSCKGGWFQLRASCPTGPLGQEPDRSMQKAGSLSQLACGLQHHLVVAGKH